MRYRLTFTAIALVIAIVSVGCGRRAATGVKLSPDFARFVPADTDVLADLELAKLKTATLYRRHENSLNFALLNASVEQIGLDPRRDISDLAIARSEKRLIVMAHGRFAPATTIRKLTDLGGRTSSYRGSDVVTFEQMAFSFWNKGLVVGGASSTLRSVLDVARDRKGAVADELEQRLRALPENDQVWVVSRGGLPFADVTMPSEYASALSNIAGEVRDTSLGIAVDDGAHVFADISCTSEQGAQRVHDGLRAAIALGRLTTKDDQQDLLRIYDAIRVDRNQSDVQINADFPAELADRLLAYATRFGKETGPEPLRR